MKLKTETEKITGVYSITNAANAANANGKVYYGRAEDIYKRWISHKSKLTKGEHKNKKLQEDWNEFGAQNFIFEILETSNLKSYKYRELWYINHFRDLGFDLYNSVSPKDKIVFDLCNYLLDLEVDFNIDYKNFECVGEKQPLNWNLHIPFRGKEVYINLCNEEAYKSNGLMDELEELNKKRQVFIDSNKDFEIISVPYSHNSDADEIVKDIIEKITMLLKDL